MSRFRSNIFKELGVTGSNVSSLAKREQHFGLVVDALENRQSALKNVIKKGLKAQHITNMLSGAGGKIEEALANLFINENRLRACLESVKSVELGMTVIYLILAPSFAA